jgi:hypothetical protein
MCLISVLPKGTKKYGPIVDDFIDWGQFNNHHGAGLMYKRHGQKTVTVDKGYWTKGELLDRYASLKFKEKDEVVIHHRIATHGDKNIANQHPFFISEDIDICTTQYNSLALPAVAHNGTFSYLHKYMIDGYSDTVAFANKIAALPGMTDLIKGRPETFKDLFSGMINGSRVVFLFPDKDMVMLGDFMEDNGYYHSNIGYKQKRFDYGGMDWTKGMSSYSGGGRSIREYGSFDDWWDEEIKKRKELEQEVAKLKAKQSSSAQLEFDELGNDPTQAAIYKQNFNSTRYCLLDAPEIEGDTLSFGEDMLKITSSNYKFLYVTPKPNLTIQGYEEDELFDIVNYGYNDAYQDYALLLRRKDTSSYYAFKLSEVHEKFDIYVRPEYVELYRHFMTLAWIHFTPTMSLIKDLYVTLTKKAVAKKSDFDVVRFRDCNSPLFALKEYFNQNYHAHNKGRYSDFQQSELTNITEKIDTQVIDIIR